MKYINFKVLFFLILTFYCICLSQLGMENWDTGYIPSFSWRVINGQDIYQDFIYKGPPITIYLHAFWMKILPIEGQFYFIRISNYIMFSLQVYCTLSGFDSIYDFKKRGFNKWLLMCICFIVSMHNFSPYPWPTTDGILFASIAFFIFAKYQSSCLALILVAVFAFLSAMTKQSFYLIPIGFLVWIFIESGFKKSLFYIISLSLILGLYFFWISSFTTLQNYFYQTSNQTSVKDLLIAGIGSYVYSFGSKWIFIAVVLFAFIPAYFLKSKSVGFFRQYLFCLIFGFLILGIFNHIFLNPLTASLQFFIVGCLALIYNYLYLNKNLKFLAPFSLGLLVAWSSAISVGYPYTVLCSTILIVSFLILFYDEILKFKYNRIIYFCLIFSMCFISFASNKYQYREKHFTQLTCDLSAISPKLNYIRTSKTTFEKHLELKKLIKKYGKNFVVAPNMPMANYLFDAQSQLPADWIITNEIMGREAVFIKICTNNKIFIFVEKEYLTDKVYVDYEILHSKITDFIVSKFNKIDETKHFYVFNALKSDEKLP